VKSFSPPPEWQCKQMSVNTVTVTRLSVTELTVGPS